MKTTISYSLGSGLVLLPSMEYKGMLIKLYVKKHYIDSN